MAFIDNLAYSLFILSFAGFLLLYVVTSVYLLYRKRERNYADVISAAKVPLCLVGAYMILMGMWGYAGNVTQGRRTGADGTGKAAVAGLRPVSIRPLSTV